MDKKQVQVVAVSTPQPTQPPLFAGIPSGEEEKERLRQQRRNTAARVRRARKANR